VEDNRVDRLRRAREAYWDVYFILEEAKLLKAALLLWENNRISDEVLLAMLRTAIDKINAYYKHAVMMLGGEDGGR